MKTAKVARAMDQLDLRPKPKSTTRKQPDFAELISTYSDMHGTIGSFAHREQSLTVIMGPPGTGKSKSARSYLQETLGNGYCYLSGQTSPIKLYEMAYQHLDLPIVLDDVDSIMSSPQGLELLKCLCNTDKVKVVQWMTQNKALAQAGVPNQFTTRSPVCIICNQWPTKLGSADAVASRADMIYFRPSCHEMIKYVATWFWDKEIFDFMKEHFPYFRQQDIRLFEKAVGLRKRFAREGQHPDFWKEEILLKWADTSAAKIVALRICMDAKYGFGYGSDKQRIADFIEETGYSEQMFKKYKAEFELEDLRSYSSLVKSIKVRSKSEPKEEHFNLLPLACLNEDEE